MTFWKWSKTASVNATADGTCPWPEGMAPSQVNDSARGNMAASAKYRDDMSGALVTGGTASAYTLTSNQGFAGPLADGVSISFWAHATNAAGATFNLDGIGALPLMAPVNVQLPAGVIIAGSPYRVRYSNTTGWVLVGVFGQPYSIPIGGFMSYLSTTPPNSSFVLPFGQAISRATYATLFSMIGTTFGVGDGSTTFNIPDLRGRVIVGQDNMGGAAAGRVTTGGGGVDGTTLGAVGGAQNVTLTTAQIPAHHHTQIAQQPTFTFSTAPVNGQAPDFGAVTNILPTGLANTVTTASDATPGDTADTGGGGSHPVMQPSIILPVLLRVI